MEDTHTQDLSLMPENGRNILLAAWGNDQLPKNFSKDKIEIWYNKKSGCCYLTNSDCDCVLYNPNTKKVELWYSTPYYGVQGFFEDLLAGYLAMCEEDQEYVDQIAENEGRKEELEVLKIQRRAMQDEELIEELEEEMFAE